MRGLVVTGAEAAEGLAMELFEFDRQIDPNEFADLAFDVGWDEIGEERRGYYRSAIRHLLRFKRVWLEAAKGDQQQHDT